jgi:hypothetical protein
MWQWGGMSATLRSGTQQKKCGTSVAGGRAEAKQGKAMIPAPCVVFYASVSLHVWTSVCKRVDGRMGRHITSVTYNTDVEHGHCEDTATTRTPKEMMIRNTA